MRELFRHLSREIKVDQSESSDRILMNNLLGTLGQLELRRCDHVILFRLTHRVVEQCRLVDVFLELWSVGSFGDTSHLGGVRVETSIRWGSGRESASSVGVVSRSILLAPDGTLTILLVGHERTNGSVDGDVAKVDTQSRDLSVLVREVSTGEKGVVGKVHSWDNVLSAECDLLDLREVVFRVGVEGKSSDILNRDQVFRNDLNVSTVLISMHHD